MGSRYRSPSAPQDAPLFLRRLRCSDDPVTDPLDRVDIGDAAAVVRAEWRADEEEWTRAALERWRHDRSLLDVLRECMHRGDTITVCPGSVTFTGRVEAVGDDLLALAAPDGRVDVQCHADAPLVVRIAERARTGGTRGDAVTTFRARLLELEMAEGEVEIGTRAVGRRRPRTAHRRPGSRHRAGPRVVRR